MKILKIIKFIYYYICSAIWEFFAEPIVIYINLNLENKQLAITIGNFSRVISNVLFAVFFGLDVWPFTLSRICGTLCYTGYLFYICFFKYKINLKEFALSNLKNSLKIIKLMDII